MIITRRRFLKQSAVGLVGLGSLGLAPQRGAAEASESALDGLTEGARLSAMLDTLSGKRPLIKRSYRPPNFETPLAYLDQVFTPNDAFFVRYHHAVIPPINASQWRLRIDGEAAARPLELSLTELQRDFPQTELAALCLCAGNRRGLFQPHLPGIQWGNGALGNAIWKGVRLRDVLNKVGIGKQAVEVALEGGDSGVMAKTPDFVKSLPLSKALDEDTLIAFSMNGAPLPHWNGFPVRLIVPGWAATYWVKHLTAIRLLSTPLDSFWMKSAYRIPRNVFPQEGRFAAQESDTTLPVTEMLVNALITHPTEGAKVSAGRVLEVRGMTWEGSSEVARVDVSVDQGRSWQEARLGADHGRYAWRPWRYAFQPAVKGMQTIWVRASNRRGIAQPLDVTWNPSGYHHNAVQKLQLWVV